jgi:thiazole synthase
MSLDKLVINGRIFKSRLFLGTGKFPSLKIMKKAIKISKTEMVTMALKRIDLENPNDNFLETIGKNNNIQLLPNTAGARKAEEAIRIAKMARAINGNDWIKLEVTPDPRFLLPDPIETLKAAETLVKDKFIVLPYINADPILAKRLEEVGTATVMPLGAPIGTNKGLKTKENIKIIIEMSTIPVVVDAGLGSPSEAALAMELGADAVLVNTAIATSNDPVLMAKAFSEGVTAGRQAFLAGLPTQKKEAVPSSPLTSFLNN